MAEITLIKLVDAARKMALEFDEELAHGATELEIEEMNDRVRKEFGIELPSLHLEFLRMVNGITRLDTLTIFSTKNCPKNQLSNNQGNIRGTFGIVEMNLELRGNNENLEQLILFAMNDRYYYGWNIEYNEYWFVAQVDDEPTKVFDTYDELMIFAFLKAIDEKYWNS